MKITLHFSKLKILQKVYNATGQNRTFVCLPMKENNRNQLTANKSREQPHSKKSFPRGKKKIKQHTKKDQKQEQIKDKDIISKIKSSQNENKFKTNK